jgi:hypothetical protein
MKKYFGLLICMLIALPQAQAGIMFNAKSAPQTNHSSEYSEYMYEEYAANGGLASEEANAAQQQKTEEEESEVSCGFFCKLTGFISSIRIETPGGSFFMK